MVVQVVTYKRISRRLNDLTEILKTVRAVMLSLFHTARLIHCVTVRRLINLSVTCVCVCVCGPTSWQHGTSNQTHLQLKPWSFITLLRSVFLEWQAPNNIGSEVDDKRSRNSPIIALLYRVSMDQMTPSIDRLIVNWSCSPLLQLIVWYGSWNEYSISCTEQLVKRNVTTSEWY